MSYSSGPMDSTMTSQSVYSVSMLMCFINAILLAGMLLSGRAQPPVLYPTLNDDV